MSYTAEEKTKIIERALDYMKRKPNTTRNKVALYAGVSVSVLERWGIELPKPITAKQRMGKTPWRIGHMV
tara:strand:+ start:3431 stop:3640 length:210 start_codon:yes stop_codon:yes gene_type:complete